MSESAFAAAEKRHGFGGAVDGLLRRIPAGSLASLLAWEIRIALRPAAQNVRLIGEFASVLKVVLLWHLLLSIPVFVLASRPQTEARFMAKVMVLAEPVMIVMPLLALSLGASVLLKASSWQLYLAAPLPWERVVRLRCLQSVLVSWLTLGMAVPFAVANAAVLTGHWRGLAVYPATLGLALVGAGIGLALVAALVRLAGPRHARRAVIGFGALIVVTAAMLPALLDADRDDSRAGLAKRDAAAAAWRVRHPVLTWWRGMFEAEWLPSFAALGVGALAFGLAVRAVAGAARQIALTVEEPLRRAVPADSRRPPSFARPLPWLMAMKEWRTVLRNPAEWLGMGINLLVAWGGLRLFLDEHSTAVQLAVGSVAMVSLLAGRLMPVFVGGEEAPGLLAAAPHSRERLLLLKIVAALLPLSVLVALAALGLGAYGGLESLIVAVLGTLAAASIALAAAARPQAVQRRSFQSTGWPEGLKPADLAAQVVLQLAWPLLALAWLSGYGWVTLAGTAALLVPLWGYWRDLVREWRG